MKAFYFAGASLEDNVVDRMIDGQYGFFRSSYE